MDKLGLAICVLIVGVFAAAIVGVLLTIAYAILATLFSVL